MTESKINYAALDSVDSEVRVALGPDYVEVMTGKFQSTHGVRLTKADNNLGYTLESMLGTASTPTSERLLGVVRHQLTLIGAAILKEMA